MRKTKVLGLFTALVAVAVLLTAFAPQQSFTVDPDLIPDNAIVTSVQHVSGSESEGSAYHRATLTIPQSEPSQLAHSFSFMIPIELGAGTKKTTCYLVCPKMQWVVGALEGHDQYVNYTDHQVLSGSEATELFSREGFAFAPPSLLKQLPIDVEKLLPASYGVMRGSYEVVTIDTKAKQLISYEMIWKRLWNGKIRNYQNVPYSSKFAGMTDDIYLLVKK